MQQFITAINFVLRFRNFQMFTNSSILLQNNIYTVLLLLSLTDYWMIQYVSLQLHTACFIDILFGVLLIASIILISHTSNRVFFLDKYSAKDVSTFKCLQSLSFWWLLAQCNFFGIYFSPFIGSMVFFLFLYLLVLWQIL